MHFLYKQRHYLFGLILASIPSLIKDVNKKKKFKLHYFLYTLFAFIIGIFSIFLEKNLYTSASGSISILYLVIAGFFMSVGIIVPGVSSTIILMLLGVYPIYLSSVSSIYLPVLIPMGIGVIIGSLIFMKLTRFLLDKFYAQTFYSIIGFTTGSVFVLVPEISFDIDGIIFILCLILGFFIFNIINKK